MTIRTSRFAFASVSGKRAQSRIALGCTSAQATTERGNDRCLDESHRRDPGEGREDQCGDSDEDGGAEAVAAATQRPGDELAGPNCTEHAADSAADRLGRIPEAEAYEHAETCRRDERHREQRARRAEDADEQHADRNAEPGADADPVPTAHGRQSTGASSLVARASGNIGRVAPPGGRVQEESR